MKQEEENFALFSYVNELNDELEGLQSRVTQLRSAIDEARALNVHRGHQQAETLDRISKQLEEQTKLADSAEDSLAEVMLTFHNNNNNNKEKSHIVASSFLFMQSASILYLLMSQISL